MSIPPPPDQAPQPPQGQPPQPGPYGPPPQPGPYAQQPGPYGYAQQVPAQPGPYNAPPSAGYGYPPQAPAQPVVQDGWITVPGGVPRRVATMGQRFLARFIDGFFMSIVVGVVGFVGFYIAALVADKLEHDSYVPYDCNQYDPMSPAYEHCTARYSASFHEPSDTGPILITIAGFALALLLVALYEWLMVAFKGATWGKSMVGLRVMRTDNGQRPGAGAGFVRYLIPVLGSLAFSIGSLLVWLSPFFDSSGKRQGWHDKAAKTVVVDIKV